MTPARRLVGGSTRAVAVTKAMKSPRVMLPSAAALTASTTIRAMPKDTQQSIKGHDGGARSDHLHVEFARVVDGAYRKRSVAVITVEDLDLAMAAH